MTDPQKIKDFFHGYGIRREMALFARTGRPIHAWRAYHWIRQAGLPTPPWFLEYLDRCAKRLTRVAPNNAEELAEALEMSAAGRHTVESRRLTAVQMVRALSENRKPGEGLKEIFDRVAKDLGVSSAFVKNAYYNWLPKN